jgi:molecular chaperone DnaK (HSP70)
MEDYLDMMGTFEVKKRCVKSDMAGSISFTIPMGFLDLCKRAHKVRDFKDVINSNERHRDDVKYAGGRLKMENGYFGGFFKKTIDSIVKHIAQLFEKEVKDVEIIVMVGGFSECMLVQDAIKKNFEQKTVIVPEEPELAVLRGAVYFGHALDAI